MLAGVNDRVEQAAELATLLDPKVFKVNLIPYNPTGAFDGSTRERDRRVQGGARPRAAAGDGAAHARPRHRGRLRAARRDALSRASRDPLRDARGRRRRRSGTSAASFLYACASGSLPAALYARATASYAYARSQSASPFASQMVEAAKRVTQRCLGEADDGVHARDLPLPSGEVLRLAFRSLAPVVARRVRRVDHAIVVLPALHQPPDLVEEVDAELPVVDRQAV